MEAFSQNGGHEPPNNGQFSSARFAFLFKVCGACHYHLDYLIHLFRRSWPSQFTDHTIVAHVAIHCYWPSLPRPRRWRHHLTLLCESLVCTLHSTTQHQHRTIKHTLILSLPLARSPTSLPTTHHCPLRPLVIHSPTITGNHPPLPTAPTRHSLTHPHSQPPTTANCIQSAFTQAWFVRRGLPRGLLHNGRWTGIITNGRHLHLAKGRVRSRHPHISITTH
jgi:hypothetical protein